MTSDMQSRLRSLRGKRGALTRRINRGEARWPDGTSRRLVRGGCCGWRRVKITVHNTRDALDREIARLLKEAADGEEETN